MRARVLGGALLALATACGGSAPQNAPPPAEAVQRRDIVVDAQATGTVEPINVVDIKSRASGQIIKMPVEVGTVVRQGDLIVQIDTRDVQNQFDQAAANAKAAEASLAVADAQRKRSDDLYQAKVITRQENETADLQYAQAQAQVVSARAALDLAKQRLEDATVRAPIDGTIIAKNVSLGTIITSSLNAVGGGTTLVQMADLSKVRSRALVNETDVGGLKAGQSVKVTIDAFPDRPFFGTVEKIEPQAVVQQSVTMFPVLVSLRNDEGFLRPGMNGEVAITVDKKEGVLAVRRRRWWRGATARRRWAWAPRARRRAGWAAACARAAPGSAARGPRARGAAAPWAGRWRAVAAVRDAARGSPQAARTRRSRPRCARASSSCRTRRGSSRRGWSSSASATTTTRKC
ncbi:MAG: efflux RND transporter periplasmic adaptor subunit [Gemmatimonadetes bacterium]|nr:efflux RND transporter periplasmic adaptor subunit [Gemmatimonadota bacterium]